MSVWMLLIALVAITKEEIVKLSKEGVSEEIILAKIAQDKTVFNLTADEILELKKEGVGEKVIAQMLNGSRPKNAGKALIVTNASHRSIRVGLSDEDRVFQVSDAVGEEIPRGGILDLSAKAGEFSLVVNGVSYRHRIHVPARVTFSGCNMAQAEVLTLTIEDEQGREVVLLDSKEKPLPSQIRTPAARAGMPRLEPFGLPNTSYLPYAGTNMLLGAGLGAVIGHQSGRRTKGALVGAGVGALLDLLNAGPYESWR